VNILRRISLSRLLLLCGLVIILGVSATALAFALGSGPTPPPKPLADAVHDALAAPPVTSLSARIQFTNHLIDASSLQNPSGDGGNDSVSGPLLSGGSGRLWIGAGGKVRLELQSDRGDTQLLYDGSTVSLYDASSNTLYRYQPPAGWDTVGQDASSDSASTGSFGSASEPRHGIPTVQQIQNTIAHLMQHATLSGATPTDVAGQAAYDVRISPARNGGLVGGAELAWDAQHGLPLRLAIYSSTASAPVLELSATDISYGPVDASVFAFVPPPGTKVTELSSSSPTQSADKQTTPTQQGQQALQAPHRHHKRVSGQAAVQAEIPFTLDAPDTLAGMSRKDIELLHLNGSPAALVTYGEGLDGIAVVESQSKPSSSQQPSTPSTSQSPFGELPKVSINASTAVELPTALGTLLRFERSGIDYILAGSVTPTVAQDAARGL
jgi:outer membrane lipoprotein-sorting protein